MKIIAKAVLPLLFVGTAYAATDAQVYSGFAVGNPELATEYDSAYSESGRADSVSSFDALVYHGLQAGNSELSFDQDTDMMRTATQPSIGDSLAGDRQVTLPNDIYHGFERGNPELN